MRRIVSIHLLAVVFAGLAMLAAAAERYVSRATPFEVMIPDGWHHEVLEHALLKLGMTSPRIATTRGVCLILVADAHESQHATQSELNETGTATFNEAFWRASAEAGGAKNVTVESRSEMRADRRVYHATLRYTASYAAKEFNVQSEMLLHSIPGRVLLSNCVVDHAHVATEAADFKIVSDSFNPLGSGVIATLRPPKTSAALAGPRAPTARAREALAISMKEAERIAAGGKR